MEEETSIRAVESRNRFGKNELTSFVNIEYNGLIRVLHNIKELVVTERPLILAFHNFNKPSTKLVPWCNLLARIAKQYEGRVDFAIADFESDLSIATKLNKFNYKLLGSKSAPRIYAFDVHKNQFRMENFVNGEVLIEFIESLLAGRLFISEPIPQIDDRKHLKTVVALNLKETISNCDRDILLFFYERWTYIEILDLLRLMEELARMLQHEDVLIAKMNVEENHVPPEFNISSYPRCIYIQKGNKTEYIQYEGETMSIEGLIGFIAVHSTNELKCCDRHGMLKERLGYKTELHLESIENITTFIQENYSNLIRVLTDVKEVEQIEKPLVVAFHNFIKFHMQLEPWYDIIADVAKCFDGRVDFAIADISSFVLDYKQFEQKDFESGTPLLIYALEKTGTQCKMDGDEYLSIDGLRDFVKKCLQGAPLARKLLSLKNAEPLVKVATSKNFRELVLNSEKNVFLAIYSPQSGDTKAFFSKLDHLANLLQEDKDQQIVKMNAIAEKPPRQFKSIYGYYPQYHYVKVKDGEKRRNFQFHLWPSISEKFIQFIADVSPNELKYYDRDGFLKKQCSMTPYVGSCCVASIDLSDPDAEFHRNAEIENADVSRHKLGNCISTVAFEGLLVLRTMNE